VKNLHVENWRCKSYCFTTRREWWVETEVKSGRELLFYGRPLRIIHGKIPNTYPQKQASQTWRPWNQLATTQVHFFELKEGKLKRENSFFFFPLSGNLLPSPRSSGTWFSWTATQRRMRLSIASTSMLWLCFQCGLNFSQIKTSVRLIPRHNERNYAACDAQKFLNGTKNSKLLF